MNKNKGKSGEKKKGKAKKKSGIPRKFPLGANPTTWKNNQDNIKLLISYPEFQNKIKEIRKKLGIPETGFSPKDSQVDFQKWSTDKFIKESDTIINSEDFQKHLKLEGEKFSRKEIKSSEYEKLLYLLHLKLPLNYLADAIKSLIGKFNLPGNYTDVLRRYIFTNTSSFTPINFSIEDIRTDRDSQKLMSISVRIYTRLNAKELRELKYQIDTYFGKRLPKIQALKDVDKELYNEKRLADRMYYDPAEDQPHKMTLAEIAEDILGSKNKSKQVYDKARDIKKLRKRRFGKQ